MGIQVTWDNEEHTILRWVVDWPLVWEEYKVATDESYQMYDTVDHQVCVIFDIRNMTEVPGNTLARFPRISSDTHPKVDYMVVLPSALVRFLPRYMAGWILPLQLRTLAP
jgi:hypothetical protein